MTKQYANSIETERLMLRTMGERISSRCHVWASDREVIRSCWRVFNATAKSSSHKYMRRVVYAGALEAHWEHQQLVRAWRL